MTDPARRRLVLALAAAGTGALLSACASAPAPQSQRHYRESISSVLASQDHRHIVAVGKDHHYVFEAPEALARALQSPARTRLTAEFTPFHVDRDGAITGDVTLRLPAGAGEDTEKEAAALGMQRQPDGSWQVPVHLAGRRYASWTYRRPDQAQEKLSRAYDIDVTTDERLDEAAVDKAVTPVRVAADGVQLIYYAALAPIIIPFIFIARARDR